MLTQEQILQIFKEKGVLLEGHFKLSSGRHAGRYLQCAQLLQYPDAAGPLCDQLGAKFKDEGVTVVVGPATGAIIVAYEVGRALGVKALFTERENGQMCLRRGFQLSATDKVLVVEDVITTGGSTREVIEVVESFGAQVVAVGSIADRSGGKIDFTVPFRSLISLEVPSYEPDQCPICQQQGAGPAIKPGSRPE